MPYKETSEVIYVERINGRDEFWTYSDHERVTLTPDAANALVRSHGFRLIRARH